MISDQKLLHLPKASHSNDADLLATFVNIPMLQGGKHGDSSTEDGACSLQRITLGYLMEVIKYYRSCTIQNS